MYESLQLKRQVLLSASEAAEMIVRVDEVIQCAPRERVPDEGRHWRVCWSGNAVQNKHIKEASHHQQSRLAFLSSVEASTTRQHPHPYRPSGVPFALATIPSLRPIRQ